MTNSSCSEFVFHSLEEAIKYIAKNNMKTFDDLKVGDIIYEFNLIENSIKSLIITEINEENDPNYVNFKLFKIQTPNNHIKSFYFRINSCIENSISNTKIWISDKNFKDSLTYIYNCGVKYNQKQIKNVLGI